MPNYNTFQEMSVKAGLQSVTSTAETNLLSGGSGSTNLVLGMPNWSKIFDGKAFVLRLAGFVTTDATGVVTIKMYYSNVSTGAKTTAIGSVATQSLASASTNFVWEGLMGWDSTSQIINGQQSGFAGTTVLSGTVITNPVTAITDIANATTWWMPTVTFAAVTTAGKIQVTDFSIDVN